MDAGQPCLEICEDEMDDGQKPYSQTNTTPGGCMRQPDKHATFLGTTPWGESNGSAPGLDLSNTPKTVPIFALSPLLTHTMTANCIGVSWSPVVKPPYTNSSRTAEKRQAPSYLNSESRYNSLECDSAVRLYCLARTNYRLPVCRCNFLADDLQLKYSAALFFRKSRLDIADGVLITGDDVVLEGVDALLRLALLVEQTTQRSFGFAQLRQQNGDVGHTLARLIEAGVGPHQTDGLEGRRLDRHGGIFDADAAARQDVNRQRRLEPHHRLLQLRASHAQVRDGQPVVSALQGFAHRSAKLAVVPQALVNQTGKEFALAFQEVVPVLQSRKLPAERKQRALGWRRLEEVFQLSSAEAPCQWWNVARSAAPTRVSASGGNSERRSQARFRVSTTLRSSSSRCPTKRRSKASAKVR